jgi:hypothetical protein
MRKKVVNEGGGGTIPAISAHLSRTDVLLMPGSPNPSSRQRWASMGRHLIGGHLVLASYLRAA